MTTRQEVKDFVFKVGVQIGLELEMDGRRVSFIVFLHLSSHGISVNLFKSVA